MDDPRLLSDATLLAKIVDFVEEERLKLHAFLAWLGEADSRNLFVGKGYASTFDFCVRCLKLSEDEAYRRIHAARAVVIRPELRTALAEGHLSLSAVSKIAPHVRRADAPMIIARAKDKTAREIDEILAPLRPEPEKRDVVRAVAVWAPSAGPALPPELRVDFSFRGTPELREALRRAGELLSHKYPAGSMAQVLLEIARDYLERHDPQKGLPGRAAPVKGGTSISVAVRRKVWSRDGGRCVFVGTAGIRCQARRFLELDHAIPRALGGRDDIGNLRMLCRAHNDSERRRILGEGRAATSWPGRATSGTS